MIKNELTCDSQFYKRMLKRMSKRPGVIQLLMERTYRTAAAALEDIKDIPFPELSRNVFFFSKNLPSKVFRRQFDAQIELAAIDPEKFVFGLHVFYNDLAAVVKRQGMTKELSSFLGSAIRQKYEGLAVDERVMSAYLRIACQIMEYIRPDKYDFESYVYGVDSKTGEYLVGSRPHPYADVWTIEQKRMHSLGREEPLCGIGKPDAYAFEQSDKAERFFTIFTDTAVAMFPLINEYNFDIVTQRGYEMMGNPLQGMSVCTDIGVLKSLLRRRRRTLPANGVCFMCHGLGDDGGRVLLKETLLGESIYLLYRLDAENGSICGYYDTAREFFFSSLLTKKEWSSCNVLPILILSLYASQVLENFSLPAIERDGRETTIEVYRKGGFLQDVYHKDSPDRKDKEDSQCETSIKWFIRRLPQGMVASRRAKALALQHGYELADDETFVRPFVKQVPARR